MLKNVKNILPTVKPMLNYIVLVVYNALREWSYSHTSILFCDCGHGGDFHGNKQWSGPFIELCSCYTKTIPENDDRMEKLLELQIDYKESKDELNVDFSSAHAKLTELKLGPAKSE